MLNILLAILSAVTIGFTSVFATDCIKNNRFNRSIYTTGFFIGIITDFLDALGVGSYATTTAMLKLSKKVNISDKLLPGTLNVSHSLPIIVQAFLFLTAVEVDFKTLVYMIVASIVGSWFGAMIISKLDERKIQVMMAIALIITAVLITLNQLGLISTGGDALKLEGTKLTIAVIGNFILGMLMTAGIGLYAPCMAMVSLLGMNPLAAFPIMMGSCAFVAPVSGVKFIKENAYDRNISLGIATGGVIGSYMAVKFVTNLDIYWIMWLVVLVALFTATTMLKPSNKKELKYSIDKIA